MGELLASFLAGVLTVAAPCILPLLPVVIGGSAVSSQGKKPSFFPAFVIVAGLTLSVIIFTLLLKATTALLVVPQEFWQIISGSLILLFGLHFLFPQGWSAISARLGLQNKSDQLLQRASGLHSTRGNFLMGMALGPVFNSCSPTYALILALILPRSLGAGVAHVIAYALGLGAVLLAIAWLGRSVVQLLKPLANPNGGLRRAIGLIFILTAILILTGGDKQFQAYVLEQGWYDPIANLDLSL